MEKCSRYPFWLRPGLGHVSQLWRESEKSRRKSCSSKLDPFWSLHLLGRLFFFSDSVLLSSFSLNLHHVRIRTLKRKDGVFAEFLFPFSNSCFLTCVKLGRNDILNSVAWRRQETILSKFRSGFFFLGKTKGLPNSQAYFWIYHALFENCIVWMTQGGPIYLCVNFWMSFLPG